MIKKILDLQKKLNIKFNETNLLEKALTHKSFNRNNNYEKLEFLGDRVLGLVLSKKLLELFPDEKEGILDKKLASLVNKNSCYAIGKRIDLEKFILTANTKNNIKKSEKKIISDCIEAIIGAIFLDMGLLEAEKFILINWRSLINTSQNIEIDSKTRLQEYSLKKFKELPHYKLISNTGPRHNPRFKVAVKINNSKYIEGTGFSKKSAEQNAASNCLSNLK